MDTSSIVGRDWEEVRSGKVTWAIGVLKGGVFGRAKGPKLEFPVNWKKLLKSSETENRSLVRPWTDEGKEGEFTRKLRARDTLEFKSDTDTDTVWEKADLG